MVESNSEETREERQRPLFPHPPWTVGIVLILAVCAILAGLSDPIWLLVGAPFILVLALFLYVRIIKRKTPDQSGPDNR
jgi:hypothetical protein